MENNEIMTNEIELAEIEAVEETTEDSEKGIDLGKAAGIALAIGISIAAADKLGKWIYRKVKPIVVANRIKKLEKEGYVVYMPEIEEETEDDFVTESEVIEDESNENE